MTGVLNAFLLLLRVPGLPDSVAKQNALDYYNKYYLIRNDGYFSKECAPGKAMDEHLSDSTWSY